MMSMSHMPVESFWLGAIGWLYLITNATRLVTYLPQIIVVWRCTDGARSVSVLTWGSWVLSQATAMVYGMLVLRDVPFVLISVINFLGCACVTVIAVRRRAQWRRTNSGGDPGLAVVRVSQEARAAEARVPVGCHSRTNP